MNNALKQLQLQYQGFVKTPSLWKSQKVFGLKQLNIAPQPIDLFTAPLPHGMRLGKRVERFVSFELQQAKNTHLLIENVQVQNKNITVGEIDCIVEQNGTPIHVEIVYKFYLYDPCANRNELEHWIGPNRRDSLIKKLNKLKDKQLPLLYSPSTQPILQSLNLKAEAIQQQVYFKAQLFTPYRSEPVPFNLLNEACLSGFYIHDSEMGVFENCKFFIPSKINWLIAVQTQVEWLDYTKFRNKISALMEAKTAPLCWVKFPNGTRQKFFVVWW